MGNNVISCCFCISSIRTTKRSTGRYCKWAYKKEHNQQKEEIYVYPIIDEKDIVWSRTIWREIDLRQKINHHFYFPNYR